MFASPEQLVGLIEIDLHGLQGDSGAASLLPAISEDDASLAAILGCLAGTRATGTEAPAGIIMQRPANRVAEPLAALSAVMRQEADLAGLEADLHEHAARLRRHIAQVAHAAG